jgi:hypothetical protein
MKGKGVFDQRYLLYDMRDNIKVSKIKKEYKTT